MEPPPTTFDPELAVYELPLGDDRRPPTPGHRACDVERERVLSHQHALWFCQLRWIVVSVLTAAGVAALFPRRLALVGWELQPAWLFAAAAILAVANAAYLVALRRLRNASSAWGVRALLGLQIGVDLIVLTVVIHYCGSRTTYAPLAYLFHIILACMFFSRGASLGVAALAAVLYVVCLGLESAGLTPPRTVLAGAPAVLAETGEPAPWNWHLVSLLMVWGIIWYLASRMAAALRAREDELAAVNRRLQASSEERARHMLQTTHQLKAPFAAIHANAQLLGGGYSGPLPEPARAVVATIAARAEMLSRQIQDMLQLANLRSRSQVQPASSVIDLAGMTRREIERLAPVAALRGISFETDLRPVMVRGNDDHLVMLIDNLLSNAVNYSLPGGGVSVTCGCDGRTTACLVVRDRGIGIPADKLPRVFRDYYRTAEAARHHKASTGLGLAIVRSVVKALQARLRIESLPGWGTRVTFRMPAVWEDVPSG